MTCPKCGGKLMVLDNVKNTDENEIYRRKVCNECGDVLFTVEYEVESNEEFKKTWNKYSRYAYSKLVKNDQRYQKKLELVKEWKRKTRKKEDQHATE